MNSPFSDSTTDSNTIVVASTDTFNSPDDIFPCTLTVTATKLNIDNYLLSENFSCIYLSTKENWTP